MADTIDGAMSALDVKNERNNEIGKADSWPWNAIYISITNRNLVTALINKIIMDKTGFTERLFIPLLILCPLSSAGLVSAFYCDFFSSFIIADY